VRPDIRQPSPSSSGPPRSGVVIPFQPSPLQRPVEPFRLVPPYTIQLPAGAVAPNALRCVPDLTGGSICR
jgi:hypothetical protein